MKDLKVLCDSLGYQFKQVQLLENALKHRSYGKNNNERLEFLGDAALNFIIGEALFRKILEAKEGDLSRLRASLVKGETLAKLARQFSLSQFLRLGHGEKVSGGAHRESILSDAMEAIIGAIYLDANFEVCKKIVLNWYGPWLDSLTSSEELKDPKTKLQEHLQGQKFPLPNYEIVDVSGEAHKQIFKICCSVEGLSLKAFGDGTSRRKAEQQAAMNYLELLKHES